MALSDVILGRTAAPPTVDVAGSLGAGSRTGSQFGALARQAQQQKQRFADETNQNKLIEMANGLNTALTFGPGQAQDDILKSVLSTATPGTAPAVALSNVLSNPNPIEKQNLLQKMVQNAQQRGLLGAMPKAEKTAEQIEREVAEKEKTQDIKEFEYGLLHPEFALRKKEEKDAEQTRLAGSKSFKNSMDLRKEFLSQSADYQKVRDAYTRVQGSTENPSPAGDLSLIFNYMKMLDPGSVVRESEFSTAASAGSYGERIKAAADRIMSGERLTESMRQDFLDKSKVLMTGIENQHKKREKSYKTIAERNKLNPEEVVIDVTAPTGQVLNFDSQGNLIQ